jgi:chaperone required for assembly of F1-ATPase
LYSKNARRKKRCFNVWKYERFDTSFNLSIPVRPDGSLPRFYSKVTPALAREAIQEDSNDWLILLDGRALKTPGGSLFIIVISFEQAGEHLRVPNELMALVVATEWDGQSKSLHTSKLPFVSS